MVSRDQRRMRLREAVRAVSAHGMTRQLGIWATIAATRLLLNVLEGRSKHRASHAAKRATDIFDLSLKKNPSETSLACARGCAFCCYSFVSASAPEIFLLAKTVCSAPHRDQAVALERVRVTDAVISGLSKPDRFAKRQPCSMLVANECSAYAGRPMACRAFASFSLPKCEIAFQTGSEDIPVPSINMEFRRNCNQALWSALSILGLPITAYELNQGLLTALETPDAEQRWLAGEDIFAGVTTDDVAELAGTNPQAKLLLTVIAIAACGREPPPNPWLQ
jgi:Fe-S-cluster containining protein